MAKKEWHSSEDTEVYHNNKDCNTGNNIEKENMETGKGDHRLCAECARNNRNHNLLGIFAAYYALRQLVETRFTGLDEAGMQELK
jgi:hypothetical protein